MFLFSLIIFPNTTANIKGNMRLDPTVYTLTLILLRKHAHSNIMNILPQNNENVQIRNSDVFLISAQNMDCKCSVEL